MNKISVNPKFMDAAVELITFCRHNNYPKENTIEFMKLTNLVDILDTEVRKYITENEYNPRTEI